jgi:hypothetical protein
MRFAAVVLVVALVLVACGSDEPLSKEDYEREMQDVASGLENQPEVEAPPEGASGEEQAQAVERVQERVREAADKFDEVSPPAEVSEAHADYVAGIRGLADDMQPVVDAARTGDQEALLRFQEESPYPSPETRQRITAARGAFQRAGYRISEDFP